MALQNEPFAVDDLIQPVVGALELQAAQKGLTLRVEAAPSLPHGLRGDAGRIRQTLFNLVGNAIKYAQRGQVRLELYPLPVSRKPGRFCLHLAVIDSGVGIAPDKLREVLEPFTQADGSYTRAQGGAGLGLSIVRRLVALMGGSLSICSEPGQGTEVHVSLWLEQTAAEAGRVEPARPAAVAPRKVLVVEDEAINRLAVVVSLQKLGYAVSQAANGREALDILMREPHDLALMDIQMPVMSGLEAVRRIRASQAGDVDPRLPVIALTACAMPEDREQIMAAGMTAYVSKPVDLAELIRTLADVERQLAADGGLRAA